MKRLPLLVYLKLKSLSGRLSALLCFLLLPLLLSLPAGLALKNNSVDQFRPAIADLAHTEDSKRLIKWLKEGQLDWEVLSYKDGLKALKNEQIQALVKIPADFSIPDNPFLVLVKGSHNESLGILMEECSIALIPLMAEHSMLNALYPYTEGKGLSYEQVRKQYMDLIPVMEKAGMHLGLKLEGDRAVLEKPRRLLFLPEYNIELLFLSLFAVMGSFSFHDKARREKLLMIPGAFWAEGISELLALFLMGMAQIFLLQLAYMILLPGMSRDGWILLILHVFLLTQIALAQCLTLVKEDQRVMTALLIMCFSAAGGACFFPMPAGFMNRIGRYLPHGWAMASLEHMKASEPLVVLLLSLLVFAGALAAAAVRLRGASRV